MINVLDESFIYSDVVSWEDGGFTCYLYLDLIEGAKPLVQASAETEEKAKQLAFEELKKSYIVVSNYDVR